VQTYHEVVEAAKRINRLARVVTFNAANQEMTRERREEVASHVMLELYCNRTSAAVTGQEVTDELVLAVFVDMLSLSDAILERIANGEDVL